MAPKGRRTDASRAREMQQRGLALARKADFLNVVAVLRHRPDIVSDLKQRFTNDEILLPSGEIDPNYKPPDLAIKKEKANEDASSSSNPAADAADAEIGSHILHRNFTSWAHVPPRFLKWLLSAQEPIALSKFSMKAITTQGAKEPNKETMLELLEFMSDIPKDMMLGDMRMLSDLNEFLSKRNIMNGRRCHSLQLPVEWATAGLFLITMDSPDGAEITITERFSNASISADIARAPGTFPSIEMNYSKKRASLAFTSPNNTFEKIPISELFIGAGHIALFSSATAAATSGLLVKREGPDSDPNATPAKRPKREASLSPMSAPAVPGNCREAISASSGQSPLAGVAPALVSKAEPAGSSQVPLAGAAVAPPPPGAAGGAGDGSAVAQSPAAPLLAKEEEEAAEEFDERFFVPPPGTTST